MRKEAKFEKEFIEKVKRLPKSWWPMKTDPGAVRGLPDRVGCINGVFCALEFKKDEKEFSKDYGRIKLQEYILYQIERSGGYTAFVTPENEEKVLTDLERISKRGFGNE